MIPNCSQEYLLFCKINTMLFEVLTKKKISFLFTALYFPLWKVISEELKPQKVTDPKMKHLKQNFK